MVAARVVEKVDLLVDLLMHQWDVMKVGRRVALKELYSVV